MPDLCCFSIFSGRNPAPIPETATGWLRFGITALPKHGPPRLLR